MVRPYNIKVSCLQDHFRNQESIQWKFLSFSCLNCAGILLVQFINWRAYVSAVVSLVFQEITKLLSKNLSGFSFYAYILFKQLRKCLSLGFPESALGMFWFLKTNDFQAAQPSLAQRSLLYFAFLSVSSAPPSKEDQLLFVLTWLLHCKFCWSC